MLERMTADPGRWIELDDGVFARRYAELDQTLGVVIGAERCLVVDTGRDEVHGAEFAAAISELTSLPVSAVITHAHWDHFFGTAAFGPIPVWSHVDCAEVIATDARAQRREWVGVYTAQGKDSYARDLGAARLVHPTDTLRERAELDLGDRVVHLVHPGHGHTGHDVVVDVPDAGVVFAGDLVEHGAPPSVGRDAYPLEWPLALDRLLELDATVIVPGHGDPVDAEFVLRQRAELQTLGELVRGVRSGELTVESALERAPYPEEFSRPALERGRV